MNRNIMAVICFLVPIVGIIIFFINVKKDRPAAFHALMWAMGGLALALVVLLAGTAVLQLKS
jgi:uncharacterized membrane protein